MLVYWTMFAIPALSAVMTRSFDDVDRFRVSRPGVALLLAAFAIIIGLRYEVGGDWFIYEQIVAQIGYESLATTLSFKDPGFGLVAWISTRLGLAGYGSTFFCGAVLTYGLWCFSRGQQSPWLVIATAVPYLLIVVGMGYVRQGAALGFILVALTKINERSVFGFLKWLGFAVLFHVAAILVLPLFGAAFVRKRFFALVPLGIVTAVTFFLVLGERLDFMIEGYVNQQMESSGAAVRILLSGLPAAIFIALRTRFPATDIERALWTAVSLTALLLVIVVYQTDATTAVDRIGLYLIPIQLYVFGNLGFVLTDKPAGRVLVTLSILALYALVLFIWLNYATHAEYWLPYRFAPLEG